MPAVPARHHSLAETNWRQAVPAAPPQGTSVHLWRAALDVPETVLEEQYQQLNQQERDRAAAFYYARDRNHFIVARFALRGLLARYLGQPASEINFTYSAYGKPRLADGPDLQFNLSHAGGYALYGFTANPTIGVDLEVIDPTIEVATLAARFFSPAEATSVLSLPADDQPAAFFRTWTRKEAFIKAHGAGLSLPLDQFGVTVDLDAPVRMQRIDWAPEEVGEWSLASFMVTNDLPGAVVVRGSVGEVSFFELGEAASQHLYH